MQTTILVFGRVVKAKIFGSFDYVDADRTITRLFLYATQLHFRSFLFDLREMKGPLSLLQESLLSITTGALYIEYYSLFKKSPLRLAVVLGDLQTLSTSFGVSVFFDGGITLFLTKDISEAQTWLMTTPSTSEGAAINLPSS